MKGNKAMTDAERQANRRKRMKKDKGSRFSVVLDRTATEQLQIICKTDKLTKKAAIEMVIHHYMMQNL